MSRTASLVEMLQYMRPEGSDTQKEFNERFIEPIMGKPDRFGNYILKVNGASKVAYMAHHDTVHSKDGFQPIMLSYDRVELPQNTDSSCLGADCTTGVWLALNMIEYEIPGLYIIHAGEEIGCVGSGAIVKEYEDQGYIVDSRGQSIDLKDYHAAISFDRKGTQDIITHQMGIRTASDSFAESLNDILGDIGMRPDSGGSYTDSNEYRGIIAECTNISVGYYDQHSKAESQNLPFVENLLTQLINADWGKLHIERDPVIKDDFDWFRGQHAQDDDELELDAMAELVRSNPYSVAQLFKDYGFSYLEICEQLGVSNVRSEYMQ